MTLWDITMALLKADPREIKSFDMDSHSYGVQFYDHHQAAQDDSTLHAIPPELQPSCAIAMTRLASSSTPVLYLHSDGWLWRLGVSAKRLFWVPPSYRLGHGLPIKKAEIGQDRIIFVANRMKVIVLMITGQCIQYFMNRVIKY